MPTIILIALAVLGWWYFQPFSSKYTSEVGYYDGGAVRYEYKSGIKSLDRCKEIAMARYDFYRSQGRGYTWSCLLENGEGGYKSRHR